MTDSEKRAKEILEEYVNYYSQVDLEQLTAKLDQLKSEAIKEFAELLKNDWIGNLYYCEDLDITDWIDNLVKEMVGE